MINVLITFIASFLIWIMFVGLFALWVIDGRIKREVALHAFFSSLFAWILAHFIKSLVPTIRPYQINGGSPLTVFPPSDGSFPSGHTAAAFALGITVWLHNKKFGFIFLLWSVLIGVARVLGNVHFPSDIIVGAILGSLVAIIVERIHLYKLLVRGKK